MIRMSLSVCHPVCNSSPFTFYFLFNAPPPYSFKISQANDTISYHETEQLLIFFFVN